jgi:2-methylcitrate dehydratase PrpD
VLMTSAITELAERLSGLAFESLAHEAVEAARQRLFDSLASFAAGSATPDGQLARRLLPETPATGDLIRYACAATRSTEIDDIHIESCTTPGSIVAPVAALAAVAGGVDDRCLLCAVVAGYEAMTRLGCAVDGALKIYQGIWTTYLCAPFAAAATGAVLAGLDPERTAHALAIAATRSTGMTGQVGGHSTSRWLMAGCAAHDGWLAARAAREGMIGDLNILERSFGPSTGTDFKPDVFAAEPNRWRIMDVDTKPFRTSRQALSATEAYLSLLGQRRAEDVEAVQVWVPSQVKAMLDHSTLDQRRLMGGLQFQLAAVTLDRDALFSAGERRPADVEALMSRVRVAEDERLTSLYPKQWGSRVRVTWRDGSTETAEVLDPHGSARKPYGWNELLAKHTRIAGRPSWLTELHGLCRRMGKEPGVSCARGLVRAVPDIQLGGRA